MFRRRIFQKRVRQVLEPLNHFLRPSDICYGYFSGSPTSGLSNGGNFSNIVGIGKILWQENGLVNVSSRMKHGMHVEYSTVLGLLGHFKGLKKF